MTWASWSLNSSSGSGTGSGLTSGASSSSSSSITGCRFTLPPSGYAALNSLMLSGSGNRPLSLRNRKLSPDQQQQEENHDYQAEAHRQDDSHHMVRLPRAGTRRIDMGFPVLPGSSARKFVSGRQRPLAGPVPETAS